MLQTEKFLFCEQVVASNYFISFFLCVFQIIDIRDIIRAKTLDEMKDVYPCSIFNIIINGCCRVIV